LAPVGWSFPTELGTKGQGISTITLPERRRHIETSMMDRTILPATHGIKFTCSSSSLFFQEFSLYYLVPLPDPGQRTVINTSLQANGSDDPGFSGQFDSAGSRMQLAHFEITRGVQFHYQPLFLVVMIIRHNPTQ